MVTTVGRAHKAKTNEQIILWCYVKQITYGSKLISGINYKVMYLITGHYNKNALLLLNHSSNYHKTSPKRKFTIICEVR